MNSTCFSQYTSMSIERFSVSKHLWVCDEKRWVECVLLSLLFTCRRMNRNA